MNRTLGGMLSALALSVTVVAGMAQPAQAAPTGAEPANQHSSKLLVRYATKSTCTIVPNYPPNDAVGNGRTWDIPTGKTIIWRYNVDSSWAVVSDPVRADNKQFPWWGFTKRACIGDSIKQQDFPAGQPVPTRILEGRSQQASGWRSVEFHVPPAQVVAQHKKTDSNATLRDPANFFIGNVYQDWHVDVTDKTRANGHWVKVYVPNAKLWGYIERNKLS